MLTILPASLLLSGPPSPFWSLSISPQQTVEKGQQPGSTLPQVDFYALRAEAYIQLCDFSSAAQNLRRAYSFQPENSKYLERLTLVLYLQVPGAAAGLPMAPVPHPSSPWLLPAVGVFLAPGTSSVSLGTFLSLCLHLVPPARLMTPPTSTGGLAPGLDKVLQHCPRELSAGMIVVCSALSNLVAVSHVELPSP